MARGEISGVTPCLAAKSACNSCPKCLMIHVGCAAGGKKVKLRLLHAWKLLNLSHGLNMVLFKLNICD